MYTTHTHKPFSISPVAIAGGVAVVAALTIGTVALDVFEGDGPPPTERSVVAEAPPGGPVPARSLADGRPALTPQQSVRDSVTIFGPSAVVPSSKWHAIGG